MRLIKNLLFLLLAGVGIYAVYIYFWGGDEKGYGIDETPLHVEMVRSIAEISTISYKDEVVEDSVEFYTSTTDQLSGNVLKMTDLDFWKYGVRASNIKRRLTLIIKGEVRYGFDFKQRPIDVQFNSDTIWLNLPKPKILDVLVVPTATEVFQENGDWHDSARRAMEKKAIQQLKKNSEALNLNEKATKQMEKLLRNIVPKDRVLLIYFH